jgi:hypothetical protein
MPAFLVELPVEQPGASGYVGGNVAVVFAADAEDALAAADAQFGQDARGLFTAIGTATEIVAETDMEGYSLHVRVWDAVPLIDVEAVTDAVAGLGANAVAIQAGGTGYTAADILTVGGGTASRAATLRVTSINAGVVDGIELVDPGEYSVLPSNPVAVTGGTGGDDATFNLTSNGGVDYTALFAMAVGLLNADAQIDGASVDLGEGGIGATDLTFIVALGGGNDDLGDKNMIVEFRKNGTAVPSLVGALTDGGVAADNLEFAIPAAAAVVQPNVLRVLKQ